MTETSTSLHGPTGLVTTPTAFSYKQNHGTIGIWNQYNNRQTVDAFYFLYGVRSWLEIGVLSDISDSNKLNFVFKINNRRQDRLFKGFPIVAFGLYGSHSYVAASYKISPLTLNIGSKLSDSEQALFFGGSLQLRKNILLQLDSEGDNYGFGLRGQLQKFQFSLLLKNQTKNALDDAQVNLGLSFSF